MVEYWVYFGRRHYDATFCVLPKSIPFETTFHYDNGDIFTWNFNFGDVIYIYIFATR